MNGSIHKWLGLCHLAGRLGHSDALRGLAYLTLTVRLDGLLVGGSGNSNGIMDQPSVMALAHT